MVEASSNWETSAEHPEGSACPSAQLSLQEWPRKGTLERERSSTNTDRREGYSWNCPGRLCCVGPSGQGSGVGFWRGFGFSRPLPTHLCFPWTNRALEKRNKSQTVLSAGFRGRRVSLCLGFSEHWNIQPPSCQNLLLQPLTSRCAGCAGQGKLGGVLGVAGARDNSGGMSPPGQGGAEGRVPCGTEHCQHMEGTQPWCRASNGNSSLNGAL